MDLFSLYNYLKESLPENNQAEALQILISVLGVKREDIILNRAQPVYESDINKIKQMIAERQLGRPLSNILQKKAFWTNEFKTTNDTLDPRADSETLIRAVLNEFKNKNSPWNILDIGTGTGCLIISILLEYPNAQGTGIDLSDKAINVARENANELQVVDRLKLKNCGWQNINFNTKYDLVISNPPYISKSETLERGVLDYDPHQALFAEDDGLAAYKELAKIIPHVLKDKNSRAILEIGSSQADAVTQIFERENMRKISLQKDLGGRDRCLIFTKSDKS